MNYVLFIWFETNNWSTKHFSNPLVFRTYKLVLTTMIFWTKFLNFKSWSMIGTKKINDLKIKFLMIFSKVLREKDCWAIVEYLRIILLLKSFLMFLIKKMLTWNENRILMISKHCLVNNVCYQIKCIWSIELDNLNDAF